MTSPSGPLIGRLFVIALLATILTLCAGALITGPSTAQADATSSTCNYAFNANAQDCGGALDYRETEVCRFAFDQKNAASCAAASDTRSRALCRYLFDQPGAYGCNDAADARLVAACRVLFNVNGASSCAAAADKRTRETCDKLFDEPYNDCLADSSARTAAVLTAAGIARVPETAAGAAGAGSNAAVTAAGAAVENGEDAAVAIQGRDTSVEGPEIDGPTSEAIPDVPNPTFGADPEGKFDRAVSAVPGDDRQATASQNRQAAASEENVLNLFGGSLGTPPNTDDDELVSYTEPELPGTAGRPSAAAATRSVKCEPASYAYHPPRTRVVKWDSRGECAATIKRIGVQGQLKKGSVSYGSFNEAASPSAGFGQPRVAVCKGSCTGLWTLASSVRFSPKPGQTVTASAKYCKVATDGGGGLLCRSLDSIFFK